VRQSQLATLRAIHEDGGRMPVTALAIRIKRPVEYTCERVKRLQKNGFVTLDVVVPYLVVMLTAKARALLARRAELDGET
jgi:DNA-binding MarR family transcriptional regulator